MDTFTDGLKPNDKVFGTDPVSMLAELQSISPNILTKDLRTRLANALAIEEIQGYIDDFGYPTNMAEYKRWRKYVAEYVAKHLGNSPAECLKSYINPELFLILEENIGE
jgi:hypothetical protein